MIKIAESKNEILEAILLRREVLCEEYKYSRLEDEPDISDLKSDIWVAMEQQKVLGTLRVNPINGNYRIQRMAVHPTARGTGLGRKLVETVLENYTGKIYLFSPKNSIGFYTKLGFHETDEFEQGMVNKYYKLEIRK